MANNWKNCSTNEEESEGRDTRHGHDVQRLRQVVDRTSRISITMAGMGERDGSLRGDEQGSKIKKSTHCHSS